MSMYIVDWGCQNGSLRDTQTVYMSTESGRPSPLSGRRQPVRNTQWMGNYAQTKFLVCMEE
jgi:hypothetical protein